MSNAMMTDRYELSMLQSFIAEGMENKKAVFEVFARRLQPGFRYGVFAGLGRLIPMIEDFQFSEQEIHWMLEEGVIDEDTYAYLYKFQFKGKITAYREGDLYFPNSPVLTVEGTLGESILLETLILSVLNHDSAIATKASRMVSVAKGRPIIEMGSRRTHEESAIAAARAAYIAGFESTSNLAAGMRHGIPTKGTAAHAFTLAFTTEGQAFDAQVRSHGASTSMLVDTYNTKQGIENAVEAVHHYTDGKGAPGAVRIDSGDLAHEAHKARVQLDYHGAFNTKIIVTSDLDEYVMKDLKDAPIDGYGVGTQLVSTPPAGFVYKLVAIENVMTNMRPVAKKAAGKASVGGKKTATRSYDRNGRIIGEVYTTEGNGYVGENSFGKDLQVVVMKNGAMTGEVVDPMQAREFHKMAFNELPVGEQTVWNGKEFEPFITAEHVEG